MSDIVWKKDLYRSDILTVAAGRSLGSALRRMEDGSAEWVVVVRTKLETGEVYYYAFRRSELQSLADEFPERTAWPIEFAMEMHEWTASRTARNRRPLGAVQGQRGPAAGRVVDFDASGRIIAIGERDRNVTSPAATEPRTPNLPIDSGTIEESMPLDLGSTRGSHASDIYVPSRAEDHGGGSISDGKLSAPTSTQTATIEVTLSAETKGEIEVGAKELVDFRMELRSEAMPLAVARAAEAKPDVPIVVLLSVENDAIEVLKDREHRFDPPASKQPRSGFFLVKGVRPGVCRLAVVFRQGGSDLGIIGLAVEVVDTGAKYLPAQGSATAAPHDPADDNNLTLLVDQRSEGGQVFYEYILTSEALGLSYLRVRSKPLLDRGGGSAATTQQFVEHIYEVVTKELKGQDDLKQLQRETRALGASLCQELFDPEVARALWPLRKQIKLVQIVSWEPYIPWELVRLCDPESGDIDDRFLAEYGLVRTLSGTTPPLTLKMAKWCYLGALFPMRSFSAIGAELDYFSGTGPDSLPGHGIMPLAIPATLDALYEALADCSFDVLHIACHAQSLHGKIDSAILIIGDKTPPDGGGPQLIEVSTETVRTEATGLKGRRPLVFLNGCETGRMGAVLTAWGGWPSVFMGAGAGAFVGSSWAVRDKPASVFSTAFYNAMLDGKPLAEAASAARATAKQCGDASWLAFKVYGHPRARRGG